MKKGFLLIALAIAAFCGAAQDSLVTFKEINFNSGYEKNAFKEYFENKNFQPLSLFLAANPAMNDDKAKAISNQINGIVGTIQSAGMEKKKPDKKIKMVYEKVHNPLLKKYELENRFHEIFASGNYNCVTATALYAIVFEDLKIPYEIKEEPTHVYLLGYPNKENILVETTTPLFGYINFNPDFKAQYVSNLKKQKIIGSEEADSKTSDELFNKYYFKNEKISLKELVGIHYMNDALFLKDHAKWKEGFNQLEKAYLFYPSQRCRYLLMVFGSEIVSKEKLPPKEKSLFVGMLSRFNNEGITPEMIKGEFTNLTQELLFRDNNKVLYQECYQIIISKITDKELKNDITYIYNFENGRAYYNLGNYQKAKPFFEQALTLQPNNLDLGGIFIGVIAQSLRTMENEKGLLDSLNRYKQKYPSLTQFNNFNSLLVNATIMQYGDAYEKGRLEVAAKCKLSIDVLIKENPNLNINYGIVGNAYSSACSYYFKKGQKARAREVLMDGLKLSPDNYQLRTRLQMIR
jgi:tetratricopeptide (TPR) repeat protein